MVGSLLEGIGEPTADAIPARASDEPVSPFRVSLKKRAEFVRVARGRRAHGRSLTLQVLARAEDVGSAPRFGLTVTKKTGNAVERNRIKRRLREALRAPGLAAQPGHDYVFVARREAQTLSFSALLADVGKALDQARIGRTRAPSPRAGKARPQMPR